MTQDVITVTEDTSAGEIAHLLETKRIKSVPVLRDGRIVGIVSSADLLPGIAAKRDDHIASATVEDETIRKRILDEMRASAWEQTERVNVMVAAGNGPDWGY